MTFNLVSGKRCQVLTSPIFVRRFQCICNFDDTVLRVWYHFSWMAVGQFFIPYRVLGYKTSQYGIKTRGQVNELLDYKEGLIIHARTPRTRKEAI